MRSTSLSNFFVSVFTQTLSSGVSQLGSLNVGTQRIQRQIKAQVHQTIDVEPSAQNLLQKTLQAQLSR
jgi:hypothetical protein